MTSKEKFSSVRKLELIFYLVLLILCFFSFILYNLSDFFEEFRKIYNHKGIIWLLISVIIHLFFLLVPFFIIYIIIFTFLDLVIVKNIYWRTIKERKSKSKTDFQNDSKTFTITALILTIINFSMWFVVDSTLLSIIYSININQFIDEILDTRFINDPFQ